MAGPSFSRLGSNFQRTVLVPGSCICFALAKQGRTEKPGACGRVFLFYGIPRSPFLILFFRTDLSVVPSVVPSFLPVCSLSYVFLPFPSRSSIKRSSLFHSSTAPTPPPLCLPLARLCRNFALLDQLSLSLFLASAATMHDDNDRKDGDGGPPVGHQVQ